MKRRLSTIDTFYNNSKGMLQLCLKIKNNTFVERILDRLNNLVLGLHTYTDDKYIYYKDNRKSFDYVKLPPSINLMESAKYMYENHTKDFSDCLASVGANDDTVVLNIAHLVADGLYIVNLCDALSNIDRNETISSFLPSNIETNFEKQINEPNEQCPFIFTDKDLLRIYDSKIKGKSTTNYIHACHSHFSVPISDLQIYNKTKNKVSNLTEALWTSYILAVSAYNDRFDKTGIVTCIDMRRFLPSHMIGWDICNQYSSINVSANNFDDNSTVKELGSKMRECLNERIERGHHYSFLKSLTSIPDGESIKGIGLELSNIGPMKISGPITDLFFKSSVSDKSTDPLISHSSYSVKTPDKNILHGMFRYKSSIIDDKTANIISKSVEYILKNINVNTSVKESIKMVQEFQNNI